MRIVFVGRDRSVPKRILLYILTIGISRRVWLHRVNKEIDGHEALAINHKLSAALLCLPIIGPSIVTAQTASRVGHMTAGSSVKYGPAALLYLLTWIPILGNAFFIGWTQSRLNRFWKYEKKHPEHGIEIDVGLDDDPKFRAEIGKALELSSQASSRFDVKKRRRREAWQKRVARFTNVRREREQVRMAGGSTPMLPWLAPEPILKRILHITCGRCEQKFDVTQDPAAETAIVCPKCGLNEVLPSLRGDVPERSEPVAVPTVHADCPKCQTKFNAVRNLYGPTTLACPNCGKTDVLPAPSSKTRTRGRKAPAKKAGAAKVAAKKTPAKKAAAKKAPSKKGTAKAAGKRAKA